MAPIHFKKKKISPDWHRNVAIVSAIVSSKQQVAAKNTWASSFNQKPVWWARLAAPQAGE